MELLEGSRFPRILSTWRKLLWLNKITKTWIAESLDTLTEYSLVFSSVLSSGIFPFMICYSFSYLKLSGA